MSFIRKECLNLYHKMFSKACEYGIRATLEIAAQSKLNQRVSLLHIAEAIDSPVAFTAKVLQKLVKAGVVESVKGPAGGFEIPAYKLPEIKLSSIVSAIDGDDIYTGCGLGLKACDAERPCPLHDQFTSIRDSLQIMLETTSLDDLVSGLTAKETFLKRA